jgi:dTDP-4-amino-4,6-dideoxygalactose transaminase
LEKRADLYNFLRERGIYAQVHYIPIHMQPYYRNKYGSQSFPIAEEYYSRCLSLPMYASLDAEDQLRVIDAIKAFYDR